MMWCLSNRADPRALPLANRHYTRQNPNSKQFVQPARNMVLLTEPADALWVTVYPFAEYVKHAWPTAWQCAMFRNEGSLLSSELILQAVAATKWKYGEPPEIGMLTFVQADKIRSTNPGYCFLMAGFRRAGYSKEDGKLALLLAPEDMPPAAEPHPMVRDGQLRLDVE